MLIFFDRVRIDGQNNVSLILNKDTMSDDEGVWVKRAKSAGSASTSSEGQAQPLQARVSAPWGAPLGWGQGGARSNSNRGGSEGGRGDRSEARLRLNAAIDKKAAERRSPSHSRSSSPVSSGVAVAMLTAAAVVPKAARSKKPETEHPIESLRKRTKTGEDKQSRKKRKKDSLIANVQNPSADQMEERDWTDYDTAKFFVETWGDDVRYLRETECLYVYFKDRWHYDKTWDLLKGMYTENMIDYLAKAIKKYNDARNTVALDIATEKLKSCQTSRDINAVAAQIKIILSQRMDNVEFDTGTEQYFNLQYNNGVFDLRLKKLRPRLKSDYVTKILDYDYMEADQISPEVHADVKRFYEQTQPDQEQRDHQLGYLALCTTGDTTRQIGKMNIGYSASNGKSTELKIHDKVFPIYTTKLDKRTFNERFEKQHKQLLELIENPIRLAYIEEMDRGKVDAQLLKDFIDGYKLNIERLYGTKEVKLHQAKLMTCSNNDPNICPDPGVMRRLPCQHYTSKFVPMLDQVDEGDENPGGSAAADAHVYPLVRGFENRFEQPEYANAYLHLLLPYIDNLSIPASAWKDFQDIAMDNDDFRDFVEQAFQVTGNAHDIVPKKQLEEHFGRSMTYCRTKFSAILADLKRLGLTYVRDERCEYVRVDPQEDWKLQTIKCRGAIHGLVQRDDLQEF
jgi:phage/plasmid-associated DNA primase